MVDRRVQIATPGSPDVLQFYPSLVAEPAALIAWLASEVSWQDEQILMFGKRLKVPRQVAWFGDANLNYRYSNHAHRAQGWPPVLRLLLDELRSKLAIQANFVLANRYRCGADYMGWHKDDEPGLAGSVVSVSLGATRRFCLEEPRLLQQPTKKSKTKSKTKHTYELSSGSVLIHPRHWRHTLRKTAKPIAERFNLSFRQVQKIV